MPEKPPFEPPVVFDRSEFDEFILDAEAQHQFVEAAERARAEGAEAKLAIDRRHAAARFAIEHAKYCNTPEEANFLLGLAFADSDEFQGAEIVGDRKEPSGLPTPAFDRVGVYPIQSQLQLMVIMNMAVSATGFTIGQEKELLKVYDDNRTQNDIYTRSSALIRQIHSTTSSYLNRLRTQDIFTWLRTKDGRKLSSFGQSPRRKQAARHLNRAYRFKSTHTSRKDIPGMFANL